MQHQMIVLRRGPSDLHTCKYLTTDGYRCVTQSVDREGLVTMLESAIDEDGRALLEINVLSIDAWRDASGGGWTWNDWRKIGKLTIREFNELGCTTLRQTRVTLAWFREHEYLSDASKGEVALEDDSYNLVVVNRRTREPLIAIEYGSVIY